MARRRRDWIRILFVTLLAGGGLFALIFAGLMISFTRDSLWLDRLMIRIKAHEVESGLTADEYCELGERTLLEERSAPKMLRAQAYYSRALDLEPKRVEAYVGIALADYQERSRATPTPFAKYWLKRARAIDSDDPSLLRAEAAVKMRSGSHDAAIRLLEAAVKRDPVRVVFHRLLAQAYAEDFQHRKARAEFEAALAMIRSGHAIRPRVQTETERTSAEGALLSLYGQELAKWNEPGAHDEALGLLRKATELRPALQGAWQAIAQLELERGHCRPAREAAEKLKGTTLEPAMGELQAEADLCQGTFDETASRETGLSHVFWLKLGDRYLKDGKLDQAAKAYAKLGHCNGVCGDPALASAKAELLERMGNLNSAIAALEPALEDREDEDAPGDARALAVAARLHAERGDRKRALDLAARALEVGYGGPTIASLDEAFAREPAYAVLKTRISARIDALFDYFERAHDRQGLRRDPVSARWALWWLGRSPEDHVAAIPIVTRYLREAGLASERVQAADALWLFGDRRSVPALLAALDDPDHEVRGYAASALGDLSDQDAVSALIDCLNQMDDDDHEPRARVADALGKLGDSRAIPFLRDSLSRDHDPLYLRWAEPALKRLQGARAPAADDEDDGPGHASPEGWATDESASEISIYD